MKKLPGDGKNGFYHALESFKEVIKFMYEGKTKKKQTNKHKHHDN